MIYLYQKNRRIDITFQPAKNNFKTHAEISSSARIRAVFDFLAGVFAKDADRLKGKEKF